MPNKTDATMATKAAPVPPGVNVIPGGDGQGIPQNSSGNAPLTAEERLEALTPLAHEIYETLRIMDASHEAMKEAGRTARETILAELGPALRAREQLNGIPHSERDIERADKAVAKIKDRLAKADAKRITGGTVFSTVKDFVNSPAYIGAAWDAASEPQPIKGVDGLPDAEILEKCREAWHVATTAKNQAERAPLGRDAIAARISQDIDKHYRPIGVQGATKPRPDGNGGMSQGHIALPYLDTIVGGTVNGVVMTSTPIDTMAILVEMFGDQIKEFLLTKAMHGIDPGTVYDGPERQRRITKAEAEIDHIERYAETVAYRMSQIGLQPKRFSARPEVILGLVKVRR